MTLLKIVILGSSIAGVSAAEAARQQDEHCDITIVSNDSHLPYLRQRLCEVVADRDAKERLLLHPQEWYAQRNITLRLNTKATRVDTGNKLVELEGGESLPYDRLILATGSSSFVPPIKGATLPGVETLWTMEDALRIEGRMQTAKQCLVIGGGLLGLEAAHAFHSRGRDSAIIERMPRLMMRQLDERAAEIFTAQVEKEGSPVTTSAIVAEIHPGKDGRVAGVRLEDGSLYPADLVLISAGVKANTQMLEGSGITVDRHIQVDDHMRTNVPDVFAAGDCAAFNGRWYGLWAVAKQQGSVAGRNAAGGDQVYDMQPPPYVVNTMGTHIASAGTIEAETLPPEQLEQLMADIVDKSEEYQYYKKLYVGDKLSGFILLGDTKAFSSLNRELVKR